MTELVRPLTVKLATLALLIGAGCALARALGAAIGIEWAKISEYEHGTAAVVPQALIVAFSAAIIVGLPLLFALLVYRGSRWVALFVTLLSLWQMSELFVYGDFFSYVVAIVAVSAIVLVWMPASRDYAHRAAEMKSQTQVPSLVK